MNTDTVRDLVLGAMVSLLPYMPGGRRSSRPQDILVIRLGSVGDFVVALPAFHAVRKLYPDACLTLVTSATLRGAEGAPPAVEVMEGDETFDNILVYHEDLSGKPLFLDDLRRQIVSKNIDLTVVLTDNRATLRGMTKYLAFLMSCGIRRIVGARLVTGDQTRMTQVERLMTLIQPLGAVTLEPPPWIHLTENAKAFARDALETCGDGPIVGLQGGAKRPANRWPPERFIEVGRFLVEKKDAHIVLTGGEAERELATKISAGIGSNCLNLAGRTSLIQLAAIGERFDAFVTNDTGPMHVVASMGTPVVVVAAARDHPMRWYPTGNQHVVIRKDIKCSPCFKNVCPLSNVSECLNRIEVAEVTEALTRVLDRQPDKEPSNNNYM